MSTERKSLSPICRLEDGGYNTLYIKREDLIPYSFGGNKARKATLFFEAFDREGCDYMVTYGSSHSNHCRVIANMCASRSVPCMIIAPSEVSDYTYNSALIDMFGAEIITVPTDKVHDTIEEKLESLRQKGFRPFFIEGGGHGNIGTEAYVQCYDEIRGYEAENGIKFDYIFFASGTGTTHAGLVCGQVMAKDERHIVGISIARPNPRGRDVVLKSINDYLCYKGITYDTDVIESNTVFIDDHVGDGYGKLNADIDDTIKTVMIKYGIPLDSTYTGKAFYGMQQYIESHDLKNKNILFIHTGGTPLFFDDLTRIMSN